MNEVVVVEPQNLPTPRFLRVRPAFWMLLTGSILFTLLTPGFVLWRASANPLAARACLWPDTPRAGVPAYVVVSLTDPHDRSAMHGPWAQVVVHWDMTTMPMGTQAVVLHGPPAAGSMAPRGAMADMFAIPLRFTMSGPWWARIALGTPGRPTWSSTLRFMVGPPTGPGGSQAMLHPDACSGGGTT